MSRNFPTYKHREIPDDLASPAPTWSPVSKETARYRSKLKDKRSQNKRHNQSSFREDRVADGSDVVDKWVVEQSRRSFIRSQKQKPENETRATGKKVINHEGWDRN